MIENDLDKVLNYMKQYVENVYEHDSEPMLNWKDIKLVLEEIERLNNIINRTTKYVQGLSSKGRGCDIYEDIKQEILKELKGDDSNE